MTIIVFFFFVGEEILIEYEEEYWRNIGDVCARRDLQLSQSDNNADSDFSVSQDIGEVSGARRITRMTQESRAQGMRAQGINAQGSSAQSRQQEQEEEEGENMTGDSVSDSDDMDTQLTQQQHHQQQQLPQQRQQHNKKKIKLQESEIRSHIEELMSLVMKTKPDEIRNFLRKLKEEVSRKSFKKILNGKDDSGDTALIVAAEKRGSKGVETVQVNK